MKTLPVLSALTLAALTVTANPASAHHAFSMFDRSDERVLSGTVARWAFNNPHSWLYMNVANEDGTETLWSFEASAVPALIQRGINGGTYEPGDKVTVLYCPLVDGRPGGGLGWVRIEDGTFTNPSDGGCNGSAQNIEKWKGLLEQGIMAVKDAG